MIRVTIIDDGYDQYDVEREVLARVGAEPMLVPCRGDAQAVVDAIRDADAVLVRESPVTAAAIAAAPRLKGIVRYGIGVDNIDRDAATARQIYIANVPDYGTEDVSDHAMALLLAVARRVPSRDAYVRGGGWYSGSREKMHRLAGKTLGLIGYGRIAQAFERKMRGFGISRVLASDPYADLPHGVEAASIEALCREADYLSLHAPLTPETRHLLNAEHLALLKPTAIIVNTSRGALIDEQALVAALQNGRVFGAGLDVLETEPPSTSNPLLKLPNVVLSDHAGWYSEESVAELQRKAAEEVARILSGQPPLNWTNRWSDTEAA
ncbi:C-terminal binding protein [Microvirga sp. HBU67558]|uniref:C-terminal binding protein n=1 Tax=Microvirga TaxID=186650 RepID=UPI001B37EA8C|nr:MULTISPECIES: C-terminal binding protein [unclassified Microvirga]MBQ0820358.1 C-terminal binding protein [Microvirga sp. HBU67558]